jgi:hypothetical protein
MARARWQIISATFVLGVVESIDGGAATKSSSLAQISHTVAGAGLVRAAPTCRHDNALRHHPAMV